MSDEVGSSWYAVRCIFAAGWPPDAVEEAYEERITLWRASSADSAIASAETEARQYASTVFDSPSAYLGLAQSYRLPDEPSDGAEVFSLIRVSPLAPHAYLDTYFDTGTERQHHVTPPET